MTASTGVAPPGQAAVRPSFGRVAWTVLRVTVSVAALGALYYLLPLDHASEPAAVTMLLIGLAGYAARVLGDHHDEHDSPGN